MKRTILAVAAAMALACSGERATDCEVQPVVQPWGAPRYFLFCGEVAAAECWPEPRASGFRWDAYYCEDR